MTQPRRDVDVSVIICVRNGARTIRRQLDALDRQMDYPPFEVIVVDNGSSDGTVQCVTAWIDGSRHAASRLRLMAGPRRPGIPATRNVGALAADGRLIAFCDADDEVDARWVGTLARGTVGECLAGGRTIARAADGSPRAGVFGDGLIATRYLPHVGTNNCAMPREAFFAVGGFDESLPRYGFEDVDFCWRAQEAGFPLIYIHDAVVHFTVSDATSSVRKKLALGRGRVLMAARYPSYDPTNYTLILALKNLAVALFTAVLHPRSLSRSGRSGLGHLVGLAGRVCGAVQYRGGRCLPARKLLRPTGESFVDGSGRRPWAIVDSLSRVPEGQQRG